MYLPADDLTARFLSVCRRIVYHINSIDLDMLLNIIEQLEAILPKDNLNDSD